MTEADRELFDLLVRLGTTSPMFQATIAGRLGGDFPAIYGTHLPETLLAEVWAGRVMRSFEATAIRAAVQEVNRGLPPDGPPGDSLLDVAGIAPGLPPGLLPRAGGLRDVFEHLFAKVQRVPDARTALAFLSSNDAPVPVVASRHSGTVDPLQGVSVAARQAIYEAYAVAVADVRIHANPYETILGLLEPLPESALPTFFVELAWRLINLKERTMRWAEGDDATTARSGIPRRGWDDPPSLFFPPGVGRSWLKSMVQRGLLQHRRAFSYGMPEEVAQGVLPEDLFARLVAPLAGIHLQRKGKSARCPSRQPDYEKDFDPNRKAPSERFDAKTLSGPWLVHRILNGMAPAPLVKVGAENDPQYEARYSFRGLPRALPHERVVPYVLPDVAVRIRVENDAAHLVSITVAYPDHGRWEPIKVSSRDHPSIRRRAARVAACAAFLSGQIDQHITRGHLIPEFVYVAMMLTLAEDHPIRKVLEPRLKEVDAVNHSADGAIWGPYGVLTLCSPLKAEGLWQKMKERLGGIDWRGYQPPSVSISRDHYAPKVFAGYWQKVREYAAAALAPAGHANWYETNPAWAAQTVALFEELHRRSVPFVPWDGKVAFDQAAVRWLDDGEFAKEDGRAHGRAFSPLDTTNPQTVMADVLQLVTFTIYHATMAHSWANVRQADDAGDRKHALICLALPLTKVGYEGADDPWLEQSNPAPCDLAYQRGVGATLTYVPVDTFADEIRGRACDDAPKDPLGPNGLAQATQEWLSGRHFQGPAEREPFPDLQVKELEYHLSRPNR